MKNNSWRIKGITIEQDQYPDEGVDSALRRIKAFCAKTTITMESHGRGYGTIKFKIGNNVEKEYAYNPYGIDIETMLKYIDECEPLIAAANQANSDNRYSQFHHPSSPPNNERPSNNEGEESQWSLTSCILQ